jgi:hypothetical protein
MISGQKYNSTTVQGKFTLAEIPTLVTLPLVVMLSMVMFSACSHQMPTSITTATSPTAPGIRGTTPAYGSDCQYHLFGIVPLNGPSDTQAALTEAKVSANADVLTDVTVDHGGGFYGLFSNRCVRVAGLGVVRGASHRDLEWADEGWTRDEQEWQGRGAPQEPEQIEDQFLGEESESVGDDRRFNTRNFDGSEASHSAGQVESPTAFVPESDREVDARARYMAPQDEQETLPLRERAVAIDEPIELSRRQVNPELDVEGAATVPTGRSVIGVTGTSETASVPPIPALGNTTPEKAEVQAIEQGSQQTVQPETSLPTAGSESLEVEIGGGSGIGVIGGDGSEIVSEENQNRERSGIGESNDIGGYGAQ